MGTAVLAAPRIASWRCAAGDDPAVPAQSFHGLIAIPVDGTATSVTCTFHPPGLRLGAVVGATSLTALILLAVAGTVRRGRRAPDDDHPSPLTTPRPLTSV